MGKVDYLSNWTIKVPHMGKVDYLSNWTIKWIQPKPEQYELCLIIDHIIIHVQKYSDKHTYLL